jgi:uncharacterized membrane protein
MIRTVGLLQQLGQSWIGELGWVWAAMMAAMEVSDVHPCDVLGRGAA